MIKALIFDFDGTLSDRNRNAYDFYAAFLRRYFTDLDEVEFEAVLQDMMTVDCNGTIEVRDRLVPFLKKYGDRFPADYADTFTDYFIANMYKYTVLKKETEEVLIRLKKDYKLAILSNGGSVPQHNKIDKTGIEKYFDVCTVSGDLGIHKPDPQIFISTAEKLKVNCEECLMVGDVFSNDILGAYYAKMIPVWLVSDDEKPADFYKGYRIRKLDELFTILEKENANEHTHH